MGAAKKVGGWLGLCSLEWRSRVETEWSVS